MMSAIVYDKNLDDASLQETATEIMILILERIPSCGKNNLEILS